MLVLTLRECNCFCVSSFVWKRRSNQARKPCHSAVCNLAVCCRLTVPRWAHSNRIVLFFFSFLIWTEGGGNGIGHLELVLVSEMKLRKQSPLKLFYVCLHETVIFFPACNYWTGVFCSEVSSAGGLRWLALCICVPGHVLAIPVEAWQQNSVSAAADWYAGTVFNPLWWS